MWNPALHFTDLWVWRTFVGVGNDAPLSPHDSVIVVWATYLAPALAGLLERYATYVSSPICARFSACLFLGMVSQARPRYLGPYTVCSSPPGEVSRPSPKRRLNTCVWLRVQGWGRCLRGTIALRPRVSRYWAMRPSLEPTTPCR